MTSRPGTAAAGSFTPVGGVTGTLADIASAVSAAGASAGCSATSAVSPDASGGRIPSSFGRLAKPPATARDNIAISSSAAAMAASASLISNARPTALGASTASPGPAPPICVSLTCQAPSALL